MEAYQPYWVLRATALQALGQSSLAREAYDAALRHTQDEAVRRFIARAAGRLKVDAQLGRVS